jgi:biopolymer transport protein ExbD
MAFSFGSGGGGRSRFRGSSTLSEINVVPLVDVVLVLLIIFMITAQAMEFGLNIEVPKVKQQQQTAEDLPVISLTRSGEIYLSDQAVNINNLAAEIRRRYPNSASAAYLRADKSTQWDAAVQVISILGAEKIDVRVVTSTQEDTRRGRR